MSRTLLNEVNVILKKSGLIQGSTGELTTLTNDALQVDIDNVVKACNRALLDVARAGVDINLRTEGTLTLVTATREYVVPTSPVFIEMVSPRMIDETLGQWMEPYPGGYSQLREDQLIPANYTGLPLFWVINPTNNKFRLNTLPTANENGRIYKFIYKTSLLLAVAADVFPLRDDATEALEDCIEQQFNRHRKGQFDQSAYQMSIAMCAQIARQLPQQSRYGVVRV